MVYATILVEEGVRMNNNQQKIGKRKKRVSLLPEGGSIYKVGCLYVGVGRFIIKPKEGFVNLFFWEAVAKAND